LTDELLGCINKEHCSAPLALYIYVIHIYIYVGIDDRYTPRRCAKTWNPIRKPSIKNSIYTRPAYFPSKTVSRKKGRKKRRIQKQFGRGILKFLLRESNAQMNRKTIRGMRNFNIVELELLSRLNVCIVHTDRGMTPVDIRFFSFGYPRS
jgi:hypothetical protein